MFKVKYSDNTDADDSIAEYKTKEMAEKAIEREMEDTKEYLNNYDYGEFAGPNGLITEIWSLDSDEYAFWERFYK